MSRALSPESHTPEMRSQQRLAEIVHINEMLPKIAPRSSRLIDIIEADQTVTNHHVTAVAETALYLADKSREQPMKETHEGYALSTLLEICEEDISIGNQTFNMLDLAITISALLHDIGKAHVPSEIVRKVGKLTEDERRIMEEHTMYSLLNISFDQKSAANIGSEVPFNLIKFLAFTHHYKYIEDRPTVSARGLPAPSPSIKVMDKVFKRDHRFAEFSYIKNSIREDKTNKKLINIDLLSLAEDMGVIDDLNRISGGKFSNQFSTRGEMQMALQSLVNLLHLSDIITRSMFGTLHDKRGASKDEIFYALNYYDHKKVSYSDFADQQIGILYDEMSAIENAEMSAIGKKSLEAANAIYYKPKRYTGRGTSPLNKQK